MRYIDTVKLRPQKSKTTKKTPGVVLAERMRSESNALTDSDREKLGEEFMKLYYARESKPVTARSR